ncbi:hypothetical protein HPB50_007801 [Hyalomma asiaticum]|uniref:Uncharacterized protein n=1 Tax=Hyalomma asiaticum TaxID=266040 RepID=A0ACB7SU52_HYAAI|nr:hypothetical protein HPB50_007801 [Hyalomma asiaticum]
MERVDRAYFTASAQAAQDKEVLSIPDLRIMATALHVRWTQAPLGVEYSFHLTLAGSPISPHNERGTGRRQLARSRLCVHGDGLQRPVMGNLLSLIFQVCALLYGMLGNETFKLAQSYQFMGLFIRMIAGPKSHEDIFGATVQLSGAAHIPGTSRLPAGMVLYELAGLPNKRMSTAQVHRFCHTMNVALVVVSLLVADSAWTATSSSSPVMGNLLSLIFQVCALFYSMLGNETLKLTQAYQFMGLFIRVIAGPNSQEDRFGATLQPSSAVRTPGMSRLPAAMVLYELAGMLRRILDHYTVEAAAF